MNPPADATTQPAAVHPGLGWARFGFGLGVVASTAANIAHSFTPSADLVHRTNELAAATGRTVDWSTWTPPLGTIIAAAFWPIALVVSVEVISRVMWPEGWRWKLMRFGGVAIVAAVAAFISYKHLHGLIRAYGEDAWSAAVGPLAIDGLMVVCSAALLAIGQNKRTANAEPVHAPAEAAPVHTAPPVHVDRKLARSTSASKPARRPAPRPGKSAEAKTPPPPRVVRMVETLKADHPAGTPGPESVKAVVDRYEWRKQDATEALRIFRADRSGPVHVIPDTPAELDRVAV